jgi:serine phosphatase RsbU (regulator of sigma subunit)
VTASLHDVPAHELAGRIVQEAARRCGGPVALYVIDLDGTRLVRVGVGLGLPAVIAGAPGVGPEIAPTAFAELDRLIEARLPGRVGVRMCVRGRAVGLLIAPPGAAEALRELADDGAAAMELAAGYTDVFERARRSEPISPAAEIQQNLLPPRVTRPEGLELAASIEPTYEVGGDWFDHAHNADGVWLAVADGVGKGPLAAGLGAVALGALRAARRNGAGLEEAASTMHRTVAGVSDRSDFVTAVLGRWDPATATFRWVNCGHPRPLVAAPDGGVEELSSPPQKPLGLSAPDRRFRAVERRLAPGERLVIYSDGVTERRRGDRSEFGVEGLRAVLEDEPAATAEATVRAIHAAVREASVAPLRDDATVMVMRVAPAGRPS